MATSYYSDTPAKKTPKNKGLYSAVQPTGGNATATGLIAAAKNNTPAIQKLPGTTQTPNIQQMPGPTQTPTIQNLPNTVQNANVQSAVKSVNDALQKLPGKPAGAYQPIATYNDAGLSAEDNALVDQYQKNWQAAKAAGNQAMMDYWHQQAENVRANYGYSGGADGYDYIPINIIDKNGNKKTAIAANDALSTLQGLYAQEQARANTYYDNARAEADAQLKAQQEAINSDYDDLTKQHYIDRELALRDLPQQLAALGYTGGLAESSLLGIGYDYENNLNEAERARSRQLAEQQRYYAQVLRDAAREKADMDSQAAWQYYNFYQQAMADQRAAEQWEKEREYTMQQNDIRLEAQKRAEALDLVESMLDAGLTPTADMIASAYGLTPAQAEGYRQNLQSANTPKYYYNDLPLDNETPVFSNTGINTTPTQAGEGMRPSEWNYVKNNIATNIRLNDTAAVEKYLDQISGMVSREQWNELAGILAAEGWENIPTY